LPWSAYSCSAANASASSISQYAIGWAKPIKLNPKKPRQEVTIVIPRGQDYRVTVVNPSGQPIVNAEVELDRHTENGPYGWSPNETTGANGQFTFKALHFNGPKASYTVNVHPIKGYRGKTIKLKPGQLNYTVQLEPGHTLTGKVLDDDTGNPIGNATVIAQPRYGTTGFSSDIKTTTNFKGDFTFQGLEAIEYTISVDDHYPAGSKVNRSPNGSAQSVTHADAPKITVQPQNDPVTLRVIKDPWR